MEQVTDLELVSIVGDFVKNNIEVEIKDKKLELRINKRFMFNTLKERKTIVALINKKLDDLVDEHLTALAKKEDERNRDL